MGPLLTAVTGGAPGVRVQRAGFHYNEGVLERRHEWKQQSATRCGKKGGEFYMSAWGRKVYKKGA